MIFLFNFQLEEFYNFFPNWFDWFSLAASLIVTVISIYFAYRVAEGVYQREKRDREDVIESNTAAELLLFDNSLKMLRRDSSAQIGSLKRYIEKKENAVDFYSGIQVDFLQFTNIRNLYDENRFKDKGVKVINDLMLSLYSLYDFRNSLRSEYRAYYEKYAYHESKFYSYRDLLYNKYFTLCNMRALNIQATPKGKTWQFYPDDLFMASFSKLREDTFKNEGIIYNNGLRSRKKLLEQFVKPLIEISWEYMPEDFNAIEINEIANEVCSAFSDMESITMKHERAIISHIESLEDAIKKIDDYMNRKKRRSCFVQ